MRQLSDLRIAPADSLRVVMASIDRNQCGIVLVTDDQGRLIGTLTDGDVRRAILAGADLDGPVSNLLAVKRDAGRKPVTAAVGTNPAALLQLMTEHHIRQLPLLDPDGAVQDLVLVDDLLEPKTSMLQAVIMAGGFGIRLRPLTEDLPKPMLTVGDRPLMEWTIAQLRDAGIRNVNITTHYKPEKIIDHFGDGTGFGVKVNYVNEANPLGTGGALGLMPRPVERTLVVNGDILSKVNYRAMEAFHVDEGAAMTVAVCPQEIAIPYGILDIADSRISGLREKPTLQFFVNAGIYLLEPRVWSCIPDNGAFNMTDLIQWLIERNEIVAGFPLHEYWLDIGRHSDYARAQSDAVEMLKAR